MDFYSEPMPTCNTCGKPAVNRIMGTGCISYGWACKAHTSARIAVLTKAHNR